MYSPSVPIFGLLLADTPLYVRDRPNTGRGRRIGYNGGLLFPPTSWDLLADAARGNDQSAKALDEFADRYYGAVRAFIAAVTHQTAEADDLTQRFFETVVLSGRLLAKADRRKGGFRPYLKQAIRNFLVDEHRRQGRSPNPDVRPDALAGGWDVVVTESVPGPDEELLRAWAQSLVAMAVSRLETICEENGQSQHFQLFMRRYVADPDQPPAWREVGEAFGLDEKIARSRADTALRRFRTLLRDLVASDLGSGEDVDNELQALIAVL
jgi:RNA polymerase sigma factor (sigma-70 family)